MKGKIHTRLMFMRHDARRWWEGFMCDMGRKLPRKFRYWTFIGVAADATVQDAQLRRMSVPDVPLNDLLRAASVDLMEPRRSRYQLERIAAAAKELWDNRLAAARTAGGAGRRAILNRLYAPREFWGDLAEALGVDERLVAEVRSVTCQLPPPGWYCTREPGHEGPCAAHPEEEVVDVEPPVYPYQDGDVTVLGPECFIGRRGDGTPVISYRGENFEPQRVEAEA